MRLSWAVRVRRGTTLLELMVVMALLAIIAGIVAFSLGKGSAAGAGHGPSDRDAAWLALLRDSAVATGRPVSSAFPGEPAPRAATAFPDGRVLVDGGATSRPRGASADAR